MNIKMLFLLLPLALGVSALVPPRPLNHVLVMVDPGHGGRDPGSFRVIGRRDTVYENQYVYDVALRVARLSRKRGGLPYLTLLRNVGERGQNSAKILPNEHDAVFALDNTKAEASKDGLLKRVQFGNRMAMKYPKYRKVWVSIHFDVVGKDSNVEGVRIIAADTSSPLARALVKSFSEAHRLRTRDALVGNGDANHGIRHLVVLSQSNNIKDRVLVELGNFNNDRDVWRLRDPKVREAYAKAIEKALEY